jgi:hypothetical protein
MGWMNQIGGLLQQYSGASATNPPPNAGDDFSRVAQHAPPSVLAQGVSDAFRSDQTPPFGQMVSSMFGQSNGVQRAGILNQLIAAVGPSVLSGGLLGGLLPNGGSHVTPEQAQQLPPQTVEVLADHAQKKDPSILDRAGEFYSQHPTLVQGLGAGALALIMSRMSRSQQ